MLLSLIPASVGRPGPPTAQAQARRAGHERLQAEVERVWRETGVPGIAVALQEGDTPPLYASAGYADVDRGIPMTSETPFFLGSISKNIFATVLLQLVEEGRLDLDEPLATFVEWPRGEEITVRMLLNHTSGIPDYFRTLGLSEREGGIPGFFSRPHPPSEIFEMMPSRDPVFDPGSDQRYSNTNGLLAGRVIEEVTGRSLADVYRERIAAPLGLDGSYLYVESDRPRTRARGYCGTPGWVSTPGELADCSFADEALPNSADGSVVASARDLLRYHRALRGGELLGEDAWRAMRHVEPGRANGLGYLIMTGPMGDHEGNAGRAMGHVSADVYYPDLDLFVVMMVNRGDVPLPIRRLLEIRYPER
jgi:D-alanyl-D-alanine carboxypeptidase